MKFILISLVLSILTICGCIENKLNCQKKYFNHESFVCVCDSEHCDFIGEVSTPERGSYKRVVSSQNEFRFEIFDGKQESVSRGTKVEIDYDTHYQTMLGFGGSFTDATGISITSLPEKAQENLLRSYFSEEGIEYNLCRVPIGGTDFSTHPYTCDDVPGDVQLESFALTKEDFSYKIPLIKRAKEMSRADIKLMACPWSPPPWMKTNGKHHGKGGLRKDMWEPFSNYMIKFVEEYEKNNVSLWSISIMNQPLSALEDWRFNACAFLAEETRDWIKTTFGPGLERANLRHLKVLVYEGTRDVIPSYPATILRDEVANKYVDGVAVHWYEDLKASPEVLSELQNEFKEKFILYTESCLGYDKDQDNKVQLGSWNRAEIYANHIIESINHYSAGWVDWNLALDIQGGPNWANNFVDAPIIVNEETGQFYKQPMFYAMGHFSKFVKPGSRRLSWSVEGNVSDFLKIAAFYDTEEEYYAVTVLNKDEREREISILTPLEKFINIQLNAKSLETIIFRSELNHRNEL